MSDEQTPGEAIDQDLVHRFRDVLNRNGYGFHYAVLKKIKELYSTQMVWLFECAEFPTSVADADTRIDFILKSRQRRFFLVCECKRANPAMADWCFVKAPFVRRNRSSERIMIEHIFSDYGGGCAKLGPPSCVYAYGGSLGHTENGYHIGVEVRNPNKTGDKGGGHNAIESAAGQVLRGLGGLINTLSQMRRPADHQQADRLDTFVMPVIFTTAKLWKSEAEIDQADLSSGILNKDQVQLESVPWLFLQYPVSPSLGHDIPRTNASDEFHKMLDSEHIRSIAVVNADGIEAFFTQFHEHDNPIDLIKF